MNTQPLKNYFFAGAAAALAMTFFVWHVGYLAGRTSTQTTLAQTTPVMNGFMGTIVSINGTSIVLKTKMNPEDTSNHEIITTSATTFDQIVPKDPLVYQDEFRAFNEETSDGTTTPPLPYSLKKVSLTDLQSGNSIIVFGDTVAGRFTASRILIEPPLTSPTKP